MAQQLRQLALPIEEPLLQAIRSFDCLEGRHVADPVAENVNAFLVDGRFLAGLEQGISSTYLRWYGAHGFIGNRAGQERGRTDPKRSVSMRLDLLEALSDPEREDRALLVAALE